MNEPKYSRYEQETIINYNQAERTASVYTHDPVLIRKLDLILAKSQEITCEKRGQVWAEYIIPKRWIKVRSPRNISEEKREELSKALKERLHGGV